MFGKNLLLGAAWTVIASLSPILQAQQPDGLEEDFWVTSASQAAEMAETTGKPILVYVRSLNCHYCDLLQKKTWQDPKIKALIARDMIPLKLTLEDNREAVEAMKVRGYPSTLLFSAGREYLMRIDGFVSPQEFTQRVSKAYLRASADTSETVRR